MYYIIKYYKIKNLKLQKLWLDHRDAILISRWMYQGSHSSACCYDGDCAPRGYLSLCCSSLGSPPLAWMLWVSSIPLARPSPHVASAWSQPAVDSNTQTRIQIKPLLLLSCGCWDLMLAMENLTNSIGLFLKSSNDTEGLSQLRFHRNHLQTH